MRSHDNNLVIALSESACCVFTLAVKTLRADLHVQHRGLAITYAEYPQIYGMPRHRFFDRRPVR